MDVVVILSKAVLCFAAVCHPVLVGRDTPTGTFQLQERTVVSPGYGSDNSVLVFTEDDTTWFAIHRTWGSLPARVAAYGRPAADRRFITHGCLNVQPYVYEKLKDCCSNAELTVVP